MTILKNRLAELVPTWRNDISTLNKQHGDVSLGNTTISQAIGGMRGMKALICDTSYLDPEEGIRFRGYTIPETRARLPKPNESGEAWPTGLWYLLLTGDIPTREAVVELENEFRARADMPKYVFDVIRALPTSTHPMTQFSIGIAALQNTSEFAKAYNAGLHKQDYWVTTLEDSMNLLARLPRLAAYIYRRSYKQDVHIEADPKLDWGANFAHMMGVKDPAYGDLMRLYLILHSDHESGNVSAHTSHLVSSALSDVYYAVAAGINGLAGPLHGLANQECLKWIMELMEHFDGVPTKEQVADYTWETLNAGRVIPGYGHAVLRQTDPRYKAQRDYALKFMANDPVVQTVSNVFEVVPDILLKHGKAKNPWPNVDAHSGALQQFYGVTEVDFYTVLFGVSRAMGITAQLIWDRAVGMSLERPKSVTVAMLKDAAGIAS